MNTDITTETLCVLIILIVTLYRFFVVGPAIARRPLIEDCMDIAIGVICGAYLIGDAVRLSNHC